MRVSGPSVKLSPVPPVPNRNRDCGGSPGSPGGKKGGLRMNESAETAGVLATSGGGAGGAGAAEPDRSKCDGGNADGGPQPSAKWNRRLWDHGLSSCPVNELTRGDLQERDDTFQKELLCLCDFPQIGSILRDSVH